MIITNLEYIPLRLLRRFIFTDNLLSKCGRLVPYYKVNQGQLSPLPIVDTYWQYCQEVGIDPTNKKILEIGIGTTNATGYEVVARGGNIYWGCEPFRSLDRRMDHRLLMDVCKRYNCGIEGIQPRVKRVDSTKCIHDDTIDIIFSHSVLEHVNDLIELFCELKRLLKNDGCMIHIVDYRDHFFKYPFHFLQFSEKTWNTLFNPGDLPRHRLHDHIEAFGKYDFSVEIVIEEYDDEEYEKIKNYLNNRFRNGELYPASATLAVLLVKNAK
ncbi:MAG: methyltransferase domain-containing protein [Candidatus Scalindua sp.]